MKTLLLPACFVAAAIVSATELKNPIAVAHEWNLVVQYGPAINTPVASLRAQCAPEAVPIAPNTYGFPTLEEVFPSPSKNEPRSRERVMPEQMMPGITLWRYRGQTYWLVPLSSDNRH